MISYYEYASFCGSKNRDLKLAYGTLDEVTFANTTILNIHKMLGLISQIYLHMKRFLIALNCIGKDDKFQQMHPSCHAKVIKIV
jgi:hypothetical protein